MNIEINLSNLRAARAALIALPKLNLGEKDGKPAVLPMQVILKWKRLLGLMNVETSAADAAEEVLIEKHRMVDTKNQPILEDKQFKMADEYWLRLRELNKVKCTIGAEPVLASEFLCGRKLEECEVPTGSLLELWEMLGPFFQDDLSAPEKVAAKK